MLSTGVKICKAVISDSSTLNKNDNNCLVSEATNLQALP